MTEKKQQQQKINSFDSNVYDVNIYLSSAELHCVLRLIGLHHRFMYEAISKTNHARGHHKLK